MTKTMLIYIKLAIRNVHKNLKSSYLNGIGIALTAMVIVFTFSLSRGIESQIVMRNIQFETGAITIKLKKEIINWENKEEGDRIYSQIETVLNNHPGISDIRKRISIYNASLYSSESTQRIKIEGLEPSERKSMDETIQLLEGDSDWSTTPNGILISKSMKEDCGLSIGDECNIVLPSADGTINMLDFIVNGIFLDTSQGNKNQAYISFDQAENLYFTNLPNRLLVDITDLEQVEQITEDISGQINNSEIEIINYKENLGTAQALSAINRSAMSGMAFFLLFISFVGICAMEVEQINERRKEIGTLLTFGFKRSSVKSIFLFESIYTSLLFLIIGLLIIITIILAISLKGGIFLGHNASFAFGSAIIRPELQLNDIFFTSLVIIVYPLAATWLSLQMMNRISLITLLNKRY